MSREPDHPSASAGAFLVVGGSLVVMALSYATNVILAWFLDPAEYGHLGAIMALMYVTTPFLSLGFPWAMMRYLPAEVSLQGRAALLKSALTGNFVLGLLCAAAYATLALVVFRERPLSLPIHMTIAGIIILFSFRSVYFRALTSLFHFQSMAVTYALEALSRLAVSLALVAFGYGVGGALGGHLASGLLALLAAHYFLRYLPWWRSPGWFHLHVFTFSLALLPGGLGLTLLFEMDILGMRAFGQETLPPEAMGYYQAARVVAMVVPFLATGAMTAVAPYIAKYAGANSEGGYIWATLRYSILFSLPVAAVLLVIPGAFLSLFFPGEYAAATTALAILAVRGVFLALLQVFTNTLQASGRPWWPAVALPLASLLELGLLAWLVPEFGLVGAAVAATVPVALAVAALFLRVARIQRLLPSPRAVMKQAIALGGMAAFLAIFPHSGRFLTIIDILLAGTLYLLLLVRLRMLVEADVETLRRALPSIPWVRRALELADWVVIRIGGAPRKTDSSA